MFFRKPPTPTPPTPPAPVIDRDRQPCRISSVDETKKFEVCIQIKGEHGVILSDARAILCSSVGSQLRTAADELAVLFDIVRERNLAALATR